MPDRLRQIFERFLDFWNKYSRRQKAIVLSSLAVVILTLVILVAVLARPNYTVVANCSSYSELSEITTLLSDNGYSYQINETLLTVSVREQDSTDVRMLLATNEIQTSGYSLSDALSTSMTTTESDRVKMWQSYLETKLAEEISSMDKVNNAQLTINLQTSSNSLFKDETGSSVSAILDLNDDMDEEEAEAIAMYIKNAVENLDSKDITILSRTGESLYSGEAVASGTSSAALNKKLKYTQQLSNLKATDIKNLVLNTGAFQDVKVIVNYDIDWSNFEEVVHNYSVPDGLEQGYYTEEYIEKSNGTSGVGGTPGTESNDEDTDYVVDDSSSTTSTYSLEKYVHALDEYVKTTTNTAGDVIKDSSTLSATLTRNIIYTEEDAKNLGYLDDMTWEEFKAANASPQQIEYSDDLVELISTGTGIPVDNITIMAFEKHYFYDAESSSRGFTFYLQLLLALLILGLLAFVVLRSSRPVTVEETEPELSVEQMLATTKESQQSVEDIDLQEKSEVRKAIEKFVDENPEAVALLLRNWLDDGWD